ncbi:hypothetical protein IC614_04595 [Allosphingosinicella flava]|uniref:DUF2975 domain-containing protein n=1 Tax=Allosphingosinicella flava TaxID=2771430 RepID=A0A7T2LMS0_9SPHN|nr:hypothetical protein [Sphingosinicella flava]QPQ55869.1 hypothetical protein IC614_04595 [Sphingosinicella flava]
MENDVNLAHRARLFCLAMMMLFFAVAAGKLVAGFLPLADPALSTLKVYCRIDMCWPETDPMRLLPPRSLQAGSLPEAQLVRLPEVIRTPRARNLMFAAEFVRSLPGIFLFVSLALASRAIAAGAGFSAIMGWLRRAAISAFVLVLAQQIANTLRATALSPVLLGREGLSVWLSGGAFLEGILLTGAAWMSVWALEKARRAEIELAEIV